ncbi:MAG: hypothetical protein ACRD0D_13810 [Acidimicrobiales bacterium]
MSTNWGLSDSHPEHRYVESLAEAVRSLEDAQHELAPSAAAGRVRR